MGGRAVECTNPGAGPAQQGELAKGDRQVDRNQERQAAVVVKAAEAWQSG